VVDAFVADLSVFGIAESIRLRGHERVGKRLDHRAQQVGTRRGEVVLGEGVQGQTADAAELMERQAGRLDVLVNNAGISGETGPGWVQDPTTLDLDVVRTVVETNVIGVIRVTNAMLPLLRRSTSPRIVNVSSAVASLIRQADPDIEIGPVMAAYSPSKSFLNAVTVQYARQFADTNILINAACPGLVATDFTGFHGPCTPEQGAATAIRLATLPDGGPTGSFFEDDGVIPW
jgi:NAD(P)-dependent dehydrogenase (short-subunit alcohol dehydrogenase family)